MTVATLLMVKDPGVDVGFEFEGMFKIKPEINV